MSMCKYTKYTVNGHLDQCLLENTDGLLENNRWTLTVTICYDFVGMVVKGWGFKGGK